MAEYLSTSEVAKYLKLNQKKIYELVAAGQLPAARLSGKWLFPKALVDAWVAERTVYPATGLMGALLDRLLVVQGSDDWLLSQVLERFTASHGEAIPTAAVGSLGGLDALEAGQAHLAGCHLGADGPGARARAPVFRLGLFDRQQGLLHDRRRTPAIRSLATACRPGVRLAARQERSGTARLVASLLEEAGLAPRWRPVGPFHSHREVAEAVRAGRADVGVGAAIAAHQAGLDFIPLATERFDLAIPPALMGHDRMRAFLEFTVEALGAESRRGHPGYGFAPLGRLSPAPARGPGPHAAR